MYLYTYISLGYTLRVKVYSGKEPRQEKVVAKDIVMELSQKYLDEGRTIVTDKFYTSVTGWPSVSGY